MPGLFDIASSGIQAYREALAVTGQNIANINTDGYRRRGVALSEISASQNDVTTIADQTGLGVRVEGITRAFDSFIAGRARDASSDFSQAEAYKAGLDTLEGALVPGDYDLGYFLGEFFDGLNGVAQAPADLAARTVALTKGSALAEGFVQLSNDLLNLRETIWQQTQSVAGDLNSLLVTLRNTQNQLIASGSGQRASNALMDARDRTISEISALVGVSVAIQPSGAATVSLGRSGNGPLLGTATQYGSLQVREDAGRLIFLAGQSPGLTETQQVSSGRLAGLSEAYRSVTQAMGALDGLASRLAAEFNQIHANGIDLNGKVGGAVFSADGVTVEPSPTNLGRFSVTATAADVLYPMAGQTRFTYSAKTGSWISRDADNKTTEHPAGAIAVGAVRLAISGTPTDGDEFVLRAAIGSAAQMRFLLDKPQDLAAAGLLSSEADIDNVGRATLDAASIPPLAPTGLPDVTRLLRDDLSTLSAVTLRQNGVLGVIPAGMASVDLVSMGRQDSVHFSMTEAQLATAGTLSISLAPAPQQNATTHSFALLPFQSFAADQRGADAGALADLLNAGTLTTQNGQRLADLGLFAAGSGGNLTIAAASTTGAITAARITASELVNGTITTGLADASTLQIFTRDGRQIVGTAFSQSEVVEYLTEANGFLPEAEYRADFLNGTDGTGYRGMEVIRRTTAGSSVLTVSATGLAPYLRLDDGARVPSNPAGTLTLQIGGETESIDIPGQIPAGLIAERINAVSADTGIRAVVSTRLSLSNIPDGTIQFTIEARNQTAIPISATVTDGALANLAAAINARSQETGISASIGSDMGTIVLVSQAGDDLILGDITSGGGAFLATAVTETAAPREAAVLLGGADGAGRVRLGGDIALRGSLPFSVDWQGASGDSAPDPFTDGLMSRTADPAGRWQDIAFHLTEGLDTAEAGPEGLSAIAAATDLTLTLRGADGTAPLSVRVDSASLPDLGSAAVAQAMADRLRSLGTVPTLTGQRDTPLPADGTTVQVLLGRQSYALTMNAGEIAVTGPEAGRITAYFDGAGSLRISATGGSLSGQTLRLSPDTPAGDAAAFGLGLPEASADLNGRAVPTPTVTRDFSFATVIDGTETTLTFPWPGDALPKSITATGASGISLEFTTTGNITVARLVIPATSGIADFRLCPSPDAKALGLVSADAELTLTGTGLRIATSGGTPVQLEAIATSLVSERLSLRGLPAEDLIVIVTGSGARRIAADFGDVTPPAAQPADFEVRLMDAPSRRVEIIERATGHSLATRNVGEDGQFTAYGMNFTLVGPLTSGDRFYVRANLDGSGDARNAVALFALGDRNPRTGLGGFGAEFSSLVTDTGAETRSAGIAESAAEARRDAAVELEAEYSGVNLDDEAARLLEQQQAYQALARVLRTASDLLDTLLNAIS